MAQIPLIELLIDEEIASQYEVDAIAFVDAPAIEKSFLAFNEDKRFQFASINEDEQEVYGAAMIPDMPIPRVTDKGEPYNVVFSKDTIKQICQKFFQKANIASFNIMHNQPISGVTLFTSFISDKTKGIMPLKGDDYPDGTWFIGAKVNNADLWAKVKSGEVKGFSVEGLFKYKPVKMEQQEAFEAIKKILLQTNFKNCI